MVQPPDRTVRNRLRAASATCPRRPLLLVAALVLLGASSTLPAGAGEGEGARTTTAELLAAQGFAIEPAPVRQIFVPYLEADREPVFVTSDSILSAYAALLESSFTRLEWVRAKQLPDVLRTLVTGLDGLELKFEVDPELVARARLRALRVLAVALGLLGEDVPVLDDASRTLVAAEVERIEQAEGVAHPTWLGSADAGFLALDYDRFRPRGLYAEHAALRRYFRATAWLQAVPFRIAIDEEHVGVLLLAHGLGRPSGNLRERRRAQQEASLFLQTWEQLIGPGDDVGIGWAGWHQSAPVTAARLARHKEQLAERAAKRPLVNDQVAVAPLGLNARILPAARLPDAVLFQHTAAPTPESAADRLPSGLEVAAALGSPVARSALEPAVLERLDGAPPLVRPDPKRPWDQPAYERGLWTLEALFADPEPDAPALFGTEAWRWKSCQTVLAAWALVRHTFVLQAKPTAYYGGGGGYPAGFVEPVPDFYARLRATAAFTRQWLEARGAFEVEPARYALASRLRVCAARVHESAPAGVRDRTYWSERGLLDVIHLVFRHLEASGVPTKVDGEGYGERLAVALERLASDLEAGESDLDAEIRGHLNAARRDLGALWDTFHETCMQLEILAHKQLRGAELTTEERQFLRRYGATLGKLHLYGGNSYLSPQDDAPRIVDVVSDPFRGVVVHAAVGRPHRILVRYPWKGEDIVCVGGVLTYYEPRGPRRLTDADWRTQLDEGGAERPAWAAALFGAPDDAGAGAR